MSTISAGTTSTTTLIHSGDTTGSLVLKTNDTGSGGTTAVTIDTSQNVGIGTSNTPSNKDTVTPKLVVNGSGVAGAMQVVRNTTVGAGGAILELTATRGSDVNSYTILQSGDGIGTVGFGGADGNEFVVAASVQCQVDGTPGDNDMPGRLMFNTTADGASSPSERMRIDSSGNVGIGTSSPAVKLHVSGGTQRIQSTGSTSDAVLTLQNDVGTQAILGIVSSGNNPANAFYVQTNAGKSLVIDSSGAVLIGATATGAYFDGNLNVFKSGALPASIKTDASGTYCLATWNSATSGNNLFQAFLTEGTPTVRGNIDYNRAGTAVRYNTTSDYRLKENITDADSALPLLASIKIRSFNWKETGYKVEHGVIAQELEKVAPDAVSVGDSNVDGEIERAWAVDTSTLVPALVKAIQEQQALIQQLQADVAALKGV